MSDREPPFVGAAMPTRLLPQHREWLIAGQRDLEIQDAASPDVLDGDWRAVVRQARDLLDGYTGRLGVHGPFLGLNLIGYDAKIRAATAERLLQSVEFAAALGATHMVLHSPFMFFGSPFLPHTPANRLGDEVALVHATLERVLPAAEQAGITLVIENIQDTNPAPLLALVRSFASERVRMSLDIGHAFLMQRIGGPTPDQWVRDAGDLLAHLHLQDTDGHLDRHWPPGWGTINWFALFEALGTLAHRPRLLLELREPMRIPAGATFLTERGLVQ
jgi:sugar phosphate isomerase/epimerase